MSRRPALFIIIFCLTALGLLARLWIYFANKPIYKDKETITFTTTLMKDPQVEGRFQRIHAISSKGDSFFITTSRFPAFSFGQTLTITGKVRVKVIENKRTVYSMFFPSIEARWNGILWLFSLIRRNLITIFSSTLPSASSSLLLGIVFGVRETMPKMLSEELRISGVTHITAASGMNVTMTAGALFTLLSRFLRRQYALLLGLLCVWLYAVLTGLDVSIVRASIMASLAFGAGLFGRQNTTFFALLATGMFMLFMNPSILTDIGFQLSFFSTAGIVLLGPYLGLSSWQSEQVFLNSQKKEKVTHLFWQDVGMTIAAQIATLPLLLLHFSQYNFLSIVANGLILWVIPILMTLGLLGAILGLIILPAGQLIIFLSMPFLAYLRWIVGIFGQKDYIVYAPNLSWQVAVGYYLLLVAMVLFLRRRGKLGQSS